MKNYSEILDYLYSQLPMFHRTGAVAYKNSLENTWALDEMFGHPHRQFKVIHIAGTNGKGSVSHMLASVLQESGYNVGLYTSPHLVDFRERIRVNGEMIPEKAVKSFVERFLDLNSGPKLEPSFFELTVAMAFDFFKERRIDIAVVEVGLGGRLDSTNIIHPEVSVITNISLDHTALLGKTVPLIAAEKAGIIKTGVPVVISESSEDYDFVFESKAAEMKSPVFFADREYDASYSMLLPEQLQIFNFQKNSEMKYPSLKTDLLGSYQRRNVAGVLKTLELLQEKNWRIDVAAIYRGLERVKTNTGLRGRWEITGHNPLVICDTGHNEGGLRVVVNQLRNMAWKKLHIVFGMVSDKDIDSVLKLMPKEAVYYFTQASVPRAMDSELLKQKAQVSGLNGGAFRPVKIAVKEALAHAAAEDVVFIGGSSFVVADYLSGR
ncbi:MAG: bifunctional folylpolyglutamate synthase/dihydrofolate synthase [Mangrovibacterium sp.]